MGRRITLSVSEGTVSPEPRPLADAQGYPPPRNATMDTVDTVCGLPHNSVEFLSHSLGGRGVHRFDAEDKLEVAVFGILRVNPHLQDLGISQRSGF